MQELPETWNYDGYNEEPVVEEIKRKYNLTSNQFNEVYSKLRLIVGLSAAWGVKLGGWPVWRVQGFFGYPNCPDCGVEMEVSFLQIMKSKVFKYDWGRNGELLVLLCPKCQTPNLWHDYEPE